MKDADEVGVGYWMRNLHPFVQGVVAVIFMFTIWSVFTGFDLGGIMNKYADAALEQSKLQFEAQLELQERQFAATEQSNVKLDTLISSVDAVNERLAVQAEEITALTRRIGAVETTVGSLAQWTCDHDQQQAPEYCGALALSGTGQEDE